MTAVQPRAAEAFLREPGARFAVVLVYGPDTGLVSERVRRLVSASVDDPDDPFQMVRLDGDEISADPGRLADEAFTMPLFGGRRAIWIRAGGKGLVASVEPVLAAPPPSCRVVIEGGDWKKSHALVGLLERSGVAATLACYADEAAGIAEIIAEETAAAGLSISPDARAALAAALGGDRIASRGEIRKLALYAHGAGRIELSDVEAVISDASLLATDEIVDAAFSGQGGRLDAALAKAWTEGVNPSVLAGAVLRHAVLLHRLRGEVEAGGDAASLVAAPAHQVYFKRRAGVAAQVSATNGVRIARIVSDLADTVLEARRTAGLGQALVSRALMRIAASARPRRG